MNTLVLTKDQVVAILPGVAHLDQYFGPLITAMAAFDILTPARMGAYLAQIGHESDKFRAMAEYADGHLYEGRLDLGNTEPGDGMRFKGRGPIQATGRDMYYRLSTYLYHDLRLLQTPELLEGPEVGFLASAWIWAVDKRLNAIADLPEAYIHPGAHQYSKFQWITVKINGGLNGYADRLANYNRAKLVLSF